MNMEKNSLFTLSIALVFAFGGIGIASGATVGEKCGSDAVSGICHAAGLFQVRCESGFTRITSGKIDCVGTAICCMPTDKLLNQPCGNQNLGKCIQGFGASTCTNIGQTQLLNQGSWTPADWNNDDCTGGAVCCVPMTTQPGGICGGNELNGDGNRVDTQGSCFTGSCPAGIPEFERSSDYFPRCAGGMKCCNSGGLAPNDINNIVARNNQNSGAVAPLPGEPQQSGVTGLLPGENGAVPIAFTNPLGNITDVNSFANQILGYLQGIVIVIAVIFLVISGIMYITSAGNEQRMTGAKNAMTAALVGVAVILVAPSFLKEIIDVMGGSAAIDQGPITGASSVTDIANRILLFLLSIVGILGIIGLVIGGGMYITAMGDERKVDKAKAMLKASLIGIVIAMASLILVKTIASIITG